ncbi:MAG: CTP synthase [Elusimicrobia bacterium]|nr:CTP synthase [Elusimicrobiota bacterium]
MRKVIFVTGGVVSSLGKGITTASIGVLLKSRGIKINVLKLDPYLNVDPGTMSPYQHGEVYVTEDGAETDLDLGYYERFLDINMSKINNATAGQIYESVLRKEREGAYLGKTIQVIPHVTNEIKSRIRKVIETAEVTIVEIGGTVGDIEGLPFLEAIRQFKIDIGRENVLYIHLTLIPYIKAAEELKTKPTQQSVGKLREIGIEPDIIIARTEKSLNEDIKAKISLFCNVSREAVIEEKDVGAGNIYAIPLILKEQKLDEIILRYLRIKPKKHNLKDWQELVESKKNFKKEVEIAIAGKYIGVKDAYKSICSALLHAGFPNKTNIKIKFVDVENKLLNSELKTADGIILPGGFGDRGIEGKIKVAEYARKNKIPFLGICLGMQCAVIEFARNVCRLENANSTEFNPKTKYPVIDLLLQQKQVKMKGGTMRLGSYPCDLNQNTISYSSYKKKNISERHRHRYEFNNKYIKILTSRGFVIAGKHNGLIEIIEIKNHPWFVATQFHPEFKSRPLNPHPLFAGLVREALVNANKKKINIRKHSKKENINIREYSR